MNYIKKNIFYILALFSTYIIVFNTYFLYELLMINLFIIPKFPFKVFINQLEHHFCFQVKQLEDLHPHTRIFVQSNWVLFRMMIDNIYRTQL